MTTTWKIFDTRYQVSNGLVIKVVYGCTVRLENLIDRKVGELELVGDPNSPDFIPYENLTEEIVVGWVKTALGAAEVSSIESALQTSVTEQKAIQDAITEKSGLPWRA